MNRRRSFLTLAATCALLIACATTEPGQPPVFDTNASGDLIVVDGQVGLTWCPDTGQSTADEILAAIDRGDASQPTLGPDNTLPGERAEASSVDLTPDGDCLFLRFPSAAVQPVDTADDTVAVVLTVGDGRTNYRSTLTVPVPDGSPAPPSSTTSSTTSTTAAPGGGGTPPPPATVAWVNPPFTTPAPQRFDAAAAGFPESGPDQGVVFGGNDGAVVLGDTLVLESFGWRALPATGSPPARTAAAMAATLDPVLGSDALLLFGGSVVTGAPLPGDLLGDTWLWDGAGWNPVLVTGPTPRYDHDMAALPSGDVILFGGTDAAGELDETWRWDPDGLGPGIPSWTQETTTGTPGARGGHSMATLPDGRVLLYGGYRANPLSPTGFDFLADTWIFDPATNTWTEEVGDTVGPRSHAAMAPIEHGGNPILVNGFDGNGTVTRVDEWNPATGTWVPRTDGNPPTSRSGHVAFTLEPPSGDGSLVVAFGGAAGGPATTDTYTLDP